MTPKTDATLDDLVDQVGNLTSATTDLLDATNVNKATLDTAVDEAKSHAKSANDANASAVNAKEQALTAANEAKAAEANATAIVHNDEGSLTPAAGKYAIANAKGHFDVGWTPLLAVMYPNSGLIGNYYNIIDSTLGNGANNGDTFWVNRIRFKFRSANQAFNINGRFVVIKESATDTVLPEAESTAERAVAFDDIFLDWDGNIVHYRSITPHRTATGYDRDAIATEHGYTKASTGLYKTADTYVLLLGRVARRNMGGYHPVYNQEGAGELRKTGTGEYYNWYNKPSNLTLDKQYLFDGTVGSGSGSIRSKSNFSRFPTGGDFYDAIYADDFTPLYYSAKSVVDRQALLFDSFNKAVAGETFSGAEGTHSCIQVVDQSDYRKSFKSKVDTTVEITNNKISSINRRKYDTIFLSESVKPDYSNVNMVIINANITYMDGICTFKGIALNNAGADVYFSEQVRETKKLTNKILYVPDNCVLKNFYLDPDGGDSSGGNTWDITDLTIQFVSVEQNSARPQFLMVDVIGSLDAMPDEWQEHGIPGNWLAVGEEGESLIPDGVNYNAKLSRKCLECYQVLYTTNEGVSWTDVTSTHKTNAEGSGNTLGTLTTPANGCFIVSYRTSANPFELASRPAEFQALGNAAYTASFLPQNGSLLVCSLINKVSVEDGWPYSGTAQIQLCNQFNALHYHATSLPTNGKFIMRGANVSELPCVKMLPCLVGNNLHIVYKEMKHNDSQWGDDNKFNIVDNQSIVTDLNGQPVIVGQKRVELPYIFDGVTY